MKRRIIAAIMLSLGLTTSTFGHVTAPIKPLEPENFKSIDILPTIEPKIEIIADFPADNRNLARIIPKIPTPEPKIESKITKSIPSVADAKAYARSKLGETQYNCLYKLFKKESNWRTKAYNKSSGAYGIPQALPGSKMAKAGPDWKINPVTQVKWGLMYIKSRYNTACNAWRHSQNEGWY